MLRRHILHELLHSHNTFSLLTEFLCMDLWITVDAAQNTCPHLPKSCRQQSCDEKDSVGFLTVGQLRGMKCLRSAMSGEIVAQLDQLG